MTIIDVIRLEVKPREHADNKEIARGDGLKRIQNSSVALLSYLDFPMARGP